MSPTTRQLAWLGAAFALAAIALSAWVAVEKAPLPGDLWLMHRIQDVGGTRRAAHLVNALGTWRLVPLAAATVLGLIVGWRRGLPRDRQLAFAVVLSLAAALTPLSEALKRIVESPRPAAELGVRVDYVRHSYGFPSGHVYGDVVVYGMMAILAPAYLPRALVLPARLVLVAIIAVAGPARVVVGAHWPSDTLGGYLWGGAVLCLLMALVEAGRTRNAV